MWIIKQPPEIIFGKNSVSEYNFPKACLVVTSKGAKSRGWLEYSRLTDFPMFSSVEPNPSMETVNDIISKFSDYKFSYIIGIGGGSVLDVAKFSAYKMNKLKILIPTTFGSGSEITRISVLKVDGKKRSFHDDKLIANTAIIDSYFIEETPENIMKNSVIDACAQCTEAYDSKNGNPYTQFLCKVAFEYLEAGILNNDKNKIVLGSMFTGLGFGNSSTTLGHALSYVYSNEGISHGHALAFTTTYAHEFNESEFLKRFQNIVKKLKFNKISLNQSLDKAAELIFADRKHLDNNPNDITKEQIISLLNRINSGNLFN